MLPEFERQSRSTQFGDINHRGTDFASQFARAYWDLLCAKRSSGYQFFVDIVGAFDAVARRYICDAGVYDERVARALAKLGPPRHVYTSLRRRSAEVIQVFFRDEDVQASASAAFRDAFEHMALDPWGSLISPGT